MIAFIVILKALLSSIFIALTVFCIYWLFKYTLKLLNFLFTVFKTLKVTVFPVHYTTIGESMSEPHSRFITVRYDFESNTVR